MEPLPISRFEHGGRAFSLREPLLVDVECDDGTWIYHNGRINLWGQGDSPEEALLDLQENFVYLWDEIAQERDELLDEPALEIKRSLLELVAGQPVAH